jgi:PBP1b-binding outer membrane lipoprotein LpoB
MNNTYIITTILILLLIIFGCIQKNRMTKDEVSKWCTEYVNSTLKPSDKTDQEIYEQCMEIYSYGKNN